MKNIIQIENVEAVEIFARLDKMQTAINAIAGTPQQIVQTTDSRSGYITRREVANLFKISLVTVHDWTNKGILQAYKIGNRVFFKQNEVENALIKKGGLYV